MAINDRRRPQNPSAGPRGAGIGVNLAAQRGSASPTPRPSTAPPAPAASPGGPGSRSRMQGGNVVPQSIPGQAPVQPQGRSGPAPGVGGATPRLESSAPQNVPMVSEALAVPEQPGAPAANEPPAATPVTEPGRAPDLTQPASPTGGVGVTTTHGFSAANRPAPEEARQIMAGLGINGAGDAPQATAGPIPESVTSQAMRDKLSDNYSMLLDRYLSLSSRAANAPTGTDQQFQRASQLRSQSERLAEILGITTREATNTFEANRSFDTTVQSTAMDNQADIARANVNNVTDLQVSENTAARGIYSDLLANSELETQQRAAVAAARAENAPTPMERLKLALAEREAQEGSFENVVNMAFGRDVFGENTGPIRDDLGNFTGLWRNRDGSARPMTPQEFNLMQRFAESGGNILDVRGPGVGGQ